MRGLGEQDSRRLCTGKTRACGVGYLPSGSWKALCGFLEGFVQVLQGVSGSHSVHRGFWQGFVPVREGGCFFGLRLILAGLERKALV